MKKLAVVKNNQAIDIILSTKWYWKAILVAPLIGFILFTMLVPEIRHNLYEAPVLSFRQMGTAAIGLISVVIYALGNLPGVLLGSPFRYIFDDLGPWFTSSWLPVVSTIFWMLVFYFVKIRQTKAK